MAPIKVPPEIREYGQRRTIPDPWVDPADVIALRERMRALYARLEALLAARRELERS